MSTSMNKEFKATQVKETNHGIREVEDFVNLFGYNVKIPSETIGSAYLQTREQIAADYPLYGQYMANMKQFAKYLKRFGSDASVESYTMRVHNIQPIYDILKIVSTLQFFKAFDENMQMYLEDNVGWGMIRLEPRYENEVLMDTKVFIGDEEIDLSKPVQIQAIDWNGRLVEEYDLVNLNSKTNAATKTPRKDANGALVIVDGETVFDYKSAAPVILAFRVADASVGSQTIHDEAYRRHGALNKADIRKSMSRSILEFPLVRLIKEDDDEKMISSYETPTFTELDYSHDIDFNDHLRLLTTYNELKEQGLFNNVREFALLNLFRWGILDNQTWKRGVEIFEAVMKAPKIPGNEQQTIIDRKLVTWGMACVQDLQKRNPDMKDDITDDIIISGSSISKLASMLSQSYLIIRALVVTDVVEDDIGFREARIALQSRRESTRRFQSIARLNTELYKIVELDQHNNIIGVINPIDVMAIVNYDVDAVVVSFDNQTTADKEKVDFYRSIRDYKPTAVEVKTTA